MGCWGRGGYDLSTLYENFQELNKIKGKMLLILAFKIVNFLKVPFTLALQGLDLLHFNYYDSLKNVLIPL